MRTLLRFTFASLACTGQLAGSLPAQAGTVCGGAYVVFRAPSSDGANSVTISIDGLNQVVVEETALPSLTPLAGCGCTAVTAKKVTCGDVSAVTGMYAYLSSGDDFFDAQTMPFPIFKVIGGAGNDTIIGGTGPDFLKGNGGDDTLRGNDGTDELRGGGGTDSLFHNLIPDSEDGDADILNCGAGLDSAAVTGSGDVITGCP